ncbi:MAG: phosphate signaling complex protein PhoU [Synergistaceae bacterium]|nr:phosphate signaling complex protein PhoU [Synergistaceae bacterium]
MDKNKSVESYLYASDKRRVVELVMKMGGMVEAALGDSMNAFITEDETLAEKVMTGDDEVNEMENEIDIECLRSIAMRQPVRDELRFIFAVLKTITDLERIGDEAVNIARRVIDLRKDHWTEASSTLIGMMGIAGTMLRDAMEAFRASDGSMCVEICRRDEQLDKNYSHVFDEFIDLIASFEKKDTQKIRAITNQMLIARHLERIGDHVQNIAERVYFMDKGQLLPSEFNTNHSRVYDRNRSGDLN